VRENQIIIDELNPAAPSRCNRADEPYFTDQYGRELDGRVGVVSFNRGIDHD
jgi:hypothetical protein